MHSRGNQGEGETGPPASFIIPRGGFHSPLIKGDRKYHLLWCPKRRRLLRDPAVWAYVVKPFRAVAAEFGFWIDELAVQRDHVHVFLEFPPK